jgi:hypothetical protein
MGVLQKLLRSRQSQKADAAQPKMSAPLQHQAAFVASHEEPSTSADMPGTKETGDPRDGIRNGMAILEEAYLVRDDEALDARVDSALDQVAAGGDSGVRVLVERLNKGVSVSGGTLSLQNWGDDAWNEFLRKAHIANALGRACAVSATSALATLTQAYSNVEQFNTIVRPAAARALSGICLNTGSQEFAQAIEGLVGALGTGTDDRRAVVRDCLQHLCEKVGEPVVRLLCEALEHDSDGDVRMYSALILGRSRNRSALSALQCALNDRNVRVQQNAASALGKTGDARAVDALTKALQSGDMGVRNNAAISLGQIKDRRAVSELTKALADGNAQVSAAAAWALKEISEA